MATLKYVIGVPKVGASSAEIDGADMYRLYTCDSTTAPSVLDASRRIAVQSTTLRFPFSGAIVGTGKEKEQSLNLKYLYNESLGYRNVVNGKPLRKITESGAKYYFAVTTKATIVYKNGYTVTSAFSGEYYVDDDKKDKTFYLRGYDNTYNAFSGNSEEGWKMFLDLGYREGGETVYKDVSIPLQAPNEDIRYIFWGKGQSQSVKIIVREDDDSRCHSEYIPLEALGDGLSVIGADGTRTAAQVCVGEFELTTDDYDYPKMAFYDKNLKFVGGATSGWLDSYIMDTNTDPSYYYKETDSILLFTSDGVRDIAGKIATEKGATGESYPKFVVFSSRQDKILKDKISVTRAYFPLFAMNDIFPPKEGNAPYYLFATADSSHPELFTESVASNVETYTPPTA